MDLTLTESDTVGLRRRGRGRRGPAAAAGTGGVHAVPRASGVVREHGGRVGLLQHHLRRTQAPQHDGDAAPGVPLLLLRRQGVDAVLPRDVHCSRAQREKQSERIG